MNGTHFFLLIFSLFILSSCATATKKDDKLCPKIYVHSDDLSLELSDVEKRLICGDSEEEAYKVIPSYQASYMLTGLLQSKGYSNPRFEYAGDLLHVYPGKLSFVEKVVVVSDQKETAGLLEKEIMRKFGKEVITPKLLDTIEAQSLTYLRNNTYPCAKVLSSVDASLGTVTITLSGLTPFMFGTVKKESVPGLHQEAFDRFYPFSSGDYFREKDLVLTEKRFLRAGVVQGTYFQESCDLKRQEFSISQQFILGTSRTIRLGIGASTEVGPMIRGKWSNQRSGPMASLWEFNVQLSFKNQFASFTMDRFLWQDSPRRSLLTTVEVERDNQLTYEEINSKFKPHMKWTRDGSSRFWSWTLGPTLIAGSYKSATNESDTKRVNTGALEGTLESTAHEFEIYDLHPESGDTLKFNFDFRHPEFGFIDPLLKLNLTYLRLIHLGALGKGEAIGGVRVNTATTWVPDRVDLSSLPPSVKFYGGGSDDVRGYKLSALPTNNGLGALTKLSLKFELRKTNVFIPTIESFTFIDTVYFGTRPWEVEDRLWYSPGTGLRWLSPIGIVQGFWARALSNKSVKDNGNQFYLGLGGVF